MDLSRLSPWRGAILTAIFAAGVAGCSGNLQKTLEEKLPTGRQAEYKSSRTGPSLEVPPDLSSPNVSDSMNIPGSAAGTATYSDYASVGQQNAASTGTDVLPQPDDIRVERSGDERWLVVDATPAQVWPRLREYWLRNGFLIKVEDPSIGIMETDWAENRADIPKDFIRTLLEKVSTALYSAATRDRFRVRLERGDSPGTTEIYISHRGAEEVTQGDGFVWQPRPSDPELEAEMLYRMMVFFGGKEEDARQKLAGPADRQDRAQLVRDRGGVASLALQEDFSRAWRRTGLALDRVGFTVEDRDRSRGIFFVRYVDPLDEDMQEKGFFSKLKFWSDDEQRRPEHDEYLISLRENGTTTEVMVLDKAGERETGPTAGRILSLLHEQLR